MPTPEELDLQHRWFAVECNNAAWALATRDRTPEEDRELLDLAHAAEYHWRAVGTELHAMRALMLVAHAHASCGLGTTALKYAEQCTAFFTARDTEPWELAFVHMIHAQAAHAAGADALHAHRYAAAQAVIDAMSEGEDRSIVMASWVRIPEPR